MTESEPIEVARAFNDWATAIPYATIRRILLDSESFDEVDAEIVKQGYPSGRELIDPEVEIGTGGFTGAAAMPSGKGRDVFFRYWRAWVEPWSDLDFVNPRYEQIGDSVISERTVTATGDLSGASVELDLAQLFVVRGGRIVAYQAYESRERALAAIEAAASD